MRLGVHHRLFWDVMPALPPVKPELDLGSEYEARTPLEFLEIWEGGQWTFPTGLGMGIGKSPLYLNIQRQSELGWHHGYMNLIDDNMRLGQVKTLA